MATSNKLKAWVRYDGQKKIVPGSLILQANKPKVGTWREVPADLCCLPCDCRKITAVNNETGWSLTDCDGRVWGCNPGPEICEAPRCIDVSKPYHGVTIGPVSCECQCTTPVSCNCYLIVNPSLGGEPLGYGLRPCGSELNIGGLLNPGEYIVACANTDSVELEVGLLMSNNGSCTPTTEFCAAPEEICMTYYISNNTGSSIIVSWKVCGSGETNELGLPPSANTTICGQLGSISAPGATINLAVIGCA